MSYPSASSGSRPPTHFAGRPSSMFPGNVATYGGHVRHEIRAPLYVPSNGGSAAATPMTPEHPPRLPNRRR
ncbi:unnamed protein product [Ambrosiozyma monospora]|uniref:Unnamed protein product n=1 Tax=Ambrosiozyma monospora TaxID=43982 RepID=A0ACB5T429_AMBMO|nr:unnamed protein product [Ambrosiozyma monospora]